MADYHKKYETVDPEDSEWDAIHRRLGNLPAKPKKEKPAPFEPTPEEVRDSQWLQEKDAEELEDLEDDFCDDAFLEEYRKKRLQELQTKNNISNFGTVIEITSKDFIPQVTNAGNGIWVVVLLTAAGHVTTSELERCITELAPDFPSTKFCKIPAEDCIPGYPRHNLPTILIYRDTNCVKHLTGSRAFGSDRITPDTLAECLNEYGPICK